MVPSANHLSYSSTSKTWAADNTATTVSYGFAIADDETLQVVKAAGTDYTSPASSGGGYNAVGAAAKVAGFFELVRVVVRVLHDALHMLTSLCICLQTPT